jgi:hypothetical protein
MPHHAACIDSTARTLQSLSPTGWSAAPLNLHTVVEGWEGGKRRGEKAHRWIERGEGARIHDRAGGPLAMSGPETHENRETNDAPKRNREQRSRRDKQGREEHSGATHPPALPLPPLTSRASSRHPHGRGSHRSKHNQSAGSSSQQFTRHRRALCASAWLPDLRIFALKLILARTKYR